MVKTTEDVDLMEEKLKEILDGIVYYRRQGGKCIVIVHNGDASGIGKLNDLIRAGLVGSSIACIEASRFDDDSLSIDVVAPTDYIIPNFKEENGNSGFIDTFRFSKLLKEQDLTLLTLRGASGFAIRNLCKYVFTEYFLNTYFPTDLFDHPEDKHFYLNGVKIKDGDYIKITDANKYDEREGEAKITHKGLEILNSNVSYKTDGDRFELRDELKKYEQIKFSQIGRSSIPYRNTFIFEPACKSIKVKGKVFLRRSDSFHIMGRIHDCRYLGEEDITCYSKEEVEKFNKLIEEAKAAVIRNKKQRFEALFIRPFAVVRTGGEEPEYIIDEDRFIQCFYTKVANTKDSRYNMTHTYDIGFIDTKQVEAGKPFVINNLPDKYKGMFIGKGGENIKALQKKLGVKIILE